MNKNNEMSTANQKKTLEDIVMDWIVLKMKDTLDHAKINENDEIVDFASKLELDMLEDFYYWELLKAGYSEKVVEEEFSKHATLMMQYAMAEFKEEE